MVVRNVSVRHRFICQLVRLRRFFAVEKEYRKATPLLQRRRGLKFEQSRIQSHVKSFTNPDLPFNIHVRE